MNNLALIVEDNADLAAIFSEALKAAGFEIEVVPDGHAALARLAAARPDIVVLDLYLPGVSGLDILEWIRADARLAGMYTILTTADVRIAATLQGQADLVLVKPVGFAQLRDLAMRLRCLERSHPADQAE